MSVAVVCLGRYMRFVPPSEAAIATFYVDVLELPLVRARAGRSADFFWAGSAQLFELRFDGRMPVMPASESDPTTAPLVPYFRVTDLAEVTADLREKGIPVTNPRRFWGGTECCIIDPLGCLIGLREVDASSALPQDIEALRRLRCGETTDSGGAPMPAGWQGLGWLVRNVADVSAMREFYVNVFGLRQILVADGRTLLDLGDNSLLELVPGGQTIRPPTNRADVPSTFMLRIRSMAVLQEEMQQRGIAFVHEVHRRAIGSCAYIADPEGHLIGLEEQHSVPGITGLPRARS